ncbi:MAG: ABC transporter ATP-binding protein [Bacilli bacterium]|nr:ABC transporter ATP-binding protein [Bacilli bacterium]
MIKLLKTFRFRDWLIVLMCILLTYINVQLELKIPDYMSKITTLIQTNSSTMSHDILVQGMWMTLFAFGSFICAGISIYFAAKLSSSFSLNVRSKLFNKVESFGIEEMKKFSTPSLITRTTNDITQIEMLIAMGLHMMLRSPIMCALAITKIVNKSIEWSMLLAGCIVLLLSVILAILLIVLPKFKIIQKLIDRINGVTRENLTGIRVIRAFNAEKFQKNRFEKANDDLTKNQLFTQRSLAFLSPVMNIVMHGLTFGIYIIGAYLIYNSMMSEKIELFSNMVVFTSYGMQVIMSFLMLAFIFMIGPRAAISASRINEVLDEDVKIKEGTYNKDTKEHGTVEFKNVSFKYPDADEYILENISFKVNKGETVAFIGSTGSGKSTLINLIPRLYDVTSGEVLVDGINVKEYTFKNLNNKVGYIPQKAVMFTGTVKDNITYGESSKRVSEDDIKEALKISQANFVNKLEKGINSYVARGGTNLSGGQKQRLSIARTIARHPEIFIFDDTFSALDYKTDLNLRKELKKYTKDSTNLIVAQRIGTIMNADKILVLDNGKCVGVGTHKELLKSCDVYKEIALSQLSEEELQNA